MGFWDQSRQPKTFILFLDTGDICRCPMARGYLGHLLKERGIEHIEIMTAGVMTQASILPTQETRQLLQEKGIEIGRYRSTQFTSALIRKADLVLGMTPFHVQRAKRLVPDARHKIFLFKEYCESDMKNVQIADPMGATLEIYKKVFREICQACDRLINMEIIVSPKPGEGVAMDTRPRRPSQPLPEVPEVEVKAAPAKTSVFGSPIDDSLAHLALSNPVEPAYLAARHKTNPPVGKVLKQNYPRIITRTKPAVQDAPYPVWVPPAEDEKPAGETEAPAPRKGRKAAAKDPAAAPAAASTTNGAAASNGASAAIDHPTAAPPEAAAADAAAAPVAAAGSKPAKGAKLPAKAATPAAKKAPPAKAKAPAPEAAIAEPAAAAPAKASKAPTASAAKSPKAKAPAGKTVKAPKPPKAEPAAEAATDAAVEEPKPAKSAKPAPAPKAAKGAKPAAKSATKSAKPAAKAKAAKGAKAAPKKEKPAKAAAKPAPETTGE